jgi:hypothetical protein
MQQPHMIARRAARRHPGQAMVEFAVVFPVFILLTIGSMLIFTWQLNINSAQFAAEEGIQQAAQPGSVLGNTGLLCNAARRAYSAAVNESFLRTTPLVPGTSGVNCNAGVPDYTRSCPQQGNKFIRPTNQNMSALLTRTLGAAGQPGAGDVMLVCAYCFDNTANRVCNSMGVNPAVKDDIELIVSVVGYKPVFSKLPFIGNRVLFYGQNDQTLQQFQ